MRQDILSKMEQIKIKCYNLKIYLVTFSTFKKLITIYETDKLNDVQSRSFPFYCRQDSVNVQLEVSAHSLGGVRHN